MLCVPSVSSVTQGWGCTWCAVSLVLGAEVPTDAVSCHMEVQLGPVWEVNGNAYASSVNMVRSIPLPPPLMRDWGLAEQPLTARHIGSWQLIP